MRCLDKDSFESKPIFRSHNFKNINVFSGKVNKKTPSIFEFKLQILFSNILIVLIPLTIISLVTIQSEAQLIHSRQQEKVLDNNIAFFLLDSFEYTLEVNGTQIFPNDTVKNSVVNEYTPSVYNISSIQYEILGHTINASDVQINVYPTKIDEVNTRVDFQIFANNAEVRGPSLNKSYDSLDIRSAYGIYNQATDKMTIHMPYSAAMQHLLQ